MRASLGIALLTSLLAGSSACVVTTQPGPVIDRSPGGGGGGGDPIGDIDPDLVGCWDWYNYHDSHTGNESYRGKLELHDDGTFEWRAYPWATSEGKGLPEYNDVGDWGVIGDDLGLYADQGSTVQRRVSFEDGSLHLDGIKQFTCL